MSTEVDSAIDICNLALDSLNANSIVSFSDSTKEAKQCNRHYAQARRAVIRAHPWNFALKRQALAKVLTPPEFEFSYAYQLPVDCLRVFRTNISYEGAVYKIEGRHILTNHEGLKILYLFDNQNPTQYDSLFIETLVARLAWKLAYPITGDINVSKNFYEAYTAMLKEARGMDAQEGSADIIQADLWLNSRLVGPDAEYEFRPIENVTS